MDADKVPISVMLVFGLWLGEKKGGGSCGDVKGNGKYGCCVRVDWSLVRQNMLREVLNYARKSLSFVLLYVWTERYNGVAEQVF